MRYLVLGAGALGGYFGARLIRGGADVTFLVRPRRDDQLKRDGLLVHAQDGETLGYKVRSVRQGGIDGPFDVVLLTCKAYDLDSALDAIAPAVGPGTAILPVLNGIRHIDVLTQRFGASQVLGGITAVNAALLPDGAIQQSHVRVNMNHLGELDGKKSARCAAIALALTAGGLPADMVDNIIASLWQKFFAYACIASLATLTRSRAGVIAQTGAGAAMVGALIDEAASVVTAEGGPLPPSLATLVQGMFSRPDSTYLPSILVDMEESRPTEGEHTIGDLVDRANRRGIAVPILTAARCNLQAYEINRTRQR